MRDTLAYHMAERDTTPRELALLLGSDERAQGLISGETQATIYEATLMAAFFKTSIYVFIGGEQCRKGTT